jgi:hypothetical protein
VLIPRWAQVGGADALRQRIAADETRAKLLLEVRENIRRRGGPASLVVAHYAPDPNLEGQPSRRDCDGAERDAGNRMQGFKGSRIEGLKDGGERMDLRPLLESSNPRIL